MQITEIAAEILARSERRAEVAAQNITNASTPGYRRRVGFDEMLRPGAAGVMAAAGRGGVSTDFSAGELTQTGNPADLAIAGQGFFAVRGEDALYYTRQGQFRRDDQGRLVTAEGRALQSVDGGDVIVGEGAFDVAADGTISRDGVPVGRIGLYDFAERGGLGVGEGGGAFSAGEAEPIPVTAPAIRQGMLESSNVNTGDEMVAMMEAVRRAETGQRLVTTYDDLMGRALNLFGQQ